MLCLVYGSFTDTNRRHRKELEFRIYRLGQKWRTEGTLVYFPCLPIPARNLSTGPSFTRTLTLPCEKPGVSSLLKWLWLILISKSMRGSCTQLWWSVWCMNCFHHFSSQSVYVEKIIEYAFKCVTGYPVFYM